MQVRVFKALWGMEGSLESQFERIAAAGYDGVEALLPDEREAPLFMKLLEQYEFDYVAQVLTAPDHFVSFETQMCRATEFHPLFVVSHSAADDMPMETQLEFYQHALHVEERTGLTVAHETHRGRAMFTPWTTARLLEAFPDLKICADFSHWCCATESMLDRHQEYLSVAIPRTMHVHARVGHPEGPQVSDPRAPEFAGALACHEAWWDEIYQHRQQQGATEFTVTPEYGPPGYLQTFPYTAEPVADIWEIALWAANRLRHRWQAPAGSTNTRTGA